MSRDLALTRIASTGRSTAVAAGRGANSGRVAIGTFSPDEFPGLVLRLRADVGITLGATPRASGAAPPVLTFSGTLTLPLGIRVEIQTSGARGAATFRYSANNGSTWTESGILTAATYAMIGAAAGMVLNFPVGAYTNDNVYQATVASWADQSSAGNTVAQATPANQPFMTTATGANGRAAVTCVRANAQSLLRASVNLFDTGPYTLIDCLKFDTLGNIMTSIANSSGGNGEAIQVSATPAFDIIHYSVADHFGGTPQTTAFDLQEVTRAVGAAPTLRTNGAAVTLGTSAADPIAPNANLAVGSLNGTTNYLDGKQAEILAYNRALGPVELARIRRNLGTWHGLTVPEILPGGLVLWVRADVGITLGATPRASGTAPPVLTFSGRLFQALGIRVEIQTTGAVGAATFRYSADNGTTWIESGVVTASTYAMIGAATGITLNFPAGTYTNDNVYQATITSWRDLTGLGNDLINATAASQPLMTTAAAALNGRASSTWDGGARWIERALFVSGTINQPNSVAVVVKVHNPAALNVVTDGGSGATRQFLRSSSAIGYGAPTNFNNGNIGIVADSTHAVVVVVNGTNSSVVVDGNIATGNVGTDQYGGLCVGANTSHLSNWDGEIPEVMIFNHGLSTVEQALVRSYLKTRYATP